MSHQHTVQLRFTYTFCEPTSNLVMSLYDASCVLFHVVTYLRACNHLNVCCDISVCISYMRYTYEVHRHLPNPTLTQYYYPLESSALSHETQLLHACHIGVISCILANGTPPCMSHYDASYCTCPHKPTMQLYANGEAMHLETQFSAQ